MAFDGWPVEITDTAGIHEVAEGLESQGIKRAREAVTEADLCLWVLDASTAPVWPEASFSGVRVCPQSAEPLLRGKGVWGEGGSEGKGRPREKTLKLVVNKVDLPPAWNLKQLPDLPCVSALTGQGMPELATLLGEWLIPDPPPPGAPVPFTLPLSQKIEEARELCWSGKHSDVIPLLEALAL
jgi:tRNA modification GTPase